MDWMQQETEDTAAMDAAALLPECAWILLDGGRCGRPADGDDGLCTYHDQEQFEERGEG